MTTELKSVPKAIGSMAEGRSHLFVTFASWLRERQLTVLVYALIVYVLSLTVGFFLTGLSATLLLSVTAGSLVVYEALIRAILFAAYGSNYRYAVFTYTLIDHPSYGYAFRKRMNLEHVRHLLFDKYIFRDAVKPSTDLRQNIEERVRFSTNSLGFRGEEFDPKVKSGVLRIFCCGGSTTAGDYVDDQSTWPMLLQHDLRERGLNVEVVNAGVQGWSSSQSLAQIKNEICHYSPDVVLMHTGWNEEFEFSSLQLGKNWPPKRLRNKREANNLYCAPNALLSQQLSIGAFLVIQALRKKFIFAPTMSFENPERWSMLQRSEYLLAWWQNLLSVAKLADENGFLLYNLTYPGLVSWTDSPAERKAYISNSRLTPLFADYQAASHLRILDSLKHMKPVIPLIDANSSFNQFREAERSSLFHDEIHMTARANSLLAKAIADRLHEDLSALIGVSQSGKRHTNVVLDSDKIAVVEELLASNKAHLTRFIKSKIDTLARNRVSRGVSEVPSDRYTTF